MAGTDRRHRVGRIGRDHQVSEDETATGPQDTGNTGEQVRLVRPLQVVEGQGRDDEVERAGRQQVAQVGHPQLERGPGQPLAAAPSMASFLSTPTAVAPG